MIDILLEWSIRDLEILPTQNIASQLMHIKFTEFNLMPRAFTSMKGKTKVENWKQESKKEEKREREL